MHRWK